MSRQFEVLVTVRTDQFRPLLLKSRSGRAARSMAKPKAMPADVDPALLVK